VTGYTALPLRLILPGLYQWTVAWPRYPLESYLIETDDGYIAIDPQDAHPEVFGSIQDNVRHVILTNHYHERAAAIWRHRYGATVWAPKADLDDLETVTADEPYSQSSVLPGGLHAVSITGTTEGEHALLWPENRGVLFVGDALGTTSYWTHGEGELGAHPKLRLPTDLARLLELNFTSLAVGHGEPMLDQAKMALAKYLGVTTRDD
jgi:glyoxylase-like metal-dependent hydrolase (beta-lactamase superfamily II)